MARALSRSTTLLTHRFRGELENAHGLRPFTLEERLKRSLPPERTFSADTPFVLLGQPSLFDSSRAPGDQHTAWAYCHVPNGSTKDVTELIERQNHAVCSRVSRLHIVEICLVSRKPRTLESESGRG